MTARYMSSIFQQSRLIFCGFMCFENDVKRSAKEVSKLRVHVSMTSLPKLWFWFQVLCSVLPEAGIRWVMITGDAEGTAAAVAG